MASSPERGRGRNNGKHPTGLSFESRFRIFSIVIATALLGLGGALLTQAGLSAGPIVGILAIFAFLLLFAFLGFYESAVRPVQTLSNVVLALREEDYSFRARGARRNDALGELSREINALADMLQGQRLKALEAVALLQRVMAEIDAPLLAFDQQDRLRLINRAAEKAFGLRAARDIGKPAAALDLGSLLRLTPEGVWQRETEGRLVRWMVRRSRFRQRGVPHTLLLLSDVSAALREEEQLAWKRLIRVLGHEISNSLAPIKSIAGSLRARAGHADAGDDLDRGLAVIEGRAESLHRFVQSYRQLAQLPPPALQRVELAPMLRRVVQLETRLRVRVNPLPEATFCADPDQLEQLFINLVRNGVEAATSRDEELETENRTAEVTISARLQGNTVSVLIADNGPGVGNEENVFVPFYTTKKHGTGVGLALARQIAEVHGGSLELRNRADGPGCVAELRMPVTAN